MAMASLGANKIPYQSMTTVHGFGLNVFSRPSSPQVWRTSLLVPDYRRTMRLVAMQERGESGIGCGFME